MSAFGTLFREMRQGKRLSQMDFALACEVSAKHISFLETGRSKPSKGMVLVGDWENIACHMLQRTYHEHLAGPFRDHPNRLLEHALTLPDVPQNWKSHVVEHLDYPAIPFTLNLGDQQLRIFSTIATIGTPLDVTAQNLRIEHFFPMDESSKAYWKN